MSTTTNSPKSSINSGLIGKTAVVTGASSGIGRAVALHLARQGVEVILAGRDIGRLRSVEQVIVAEGGNASGLRLDLASSELIDEFVSKVLDKWPLLHFLINCGGDYASGYLREASAADLENLLHTNVCGTFQVTRGLLPLLSKIGGDVVFVNSSIVDSDGKGVGLYAASKHALKGLADALRAEISPEGVRVLSVFPGRTATPLQRIIHEMEGQTYRPDRLLQPEDVALAIRTCLSMPETAEVTEFRMRPRYKS